MGGNVGLATTEASGLMKVNLHESGSWQIDIRPNTSTANAPLESGRASRVTGRFGSGPYP
jgi:hypothetical protein